MDGEINIKYAAVIASYVLDAMACAYIIAALLLTPLVFASRGQLALYHLGLCACIILFFGCSIMAHDTPAEIYQAW